MKKKLISMLLALALLFTVLPLDAIATQTLSETPGESSGETPGEDPGEDPGEGSEEESDALLKAKTKEISHVPHIAAGEVTIMDLIATDAGLLSFTKGTPATTGSVKVSNWSVNGNGLVAFTLSGGAIGDTVTLPITIDSEKYGTDTVSLVIKLEYKQLTINCAATVVFGDTLRLTCAGQNGTAAVIYSITSGSDVASINGDILTPLKVGTVTVRATQVASGETEAQTSDAVTITVTKATPTGKPVYTKLDRAGQTLADTALQQSGFSVPGTVEWVLSDETVVIANTAYEWVFTPQNTANYNTITGSVTPYTVSEDVFVIGQGTTELNKDGSYTTTSFGEDDSSYRLTEYPDGSMRMVHTRMDGTVTTTTLDADGTYTTKVERPDRSSQITSYHESGITYTTLKDKYGYTSVQIALPDYLTDDAAKTGEVILLPMPEVPCTDDRDDAPTIVFSLDTKSPVRVSIPINNPSTGTVAITIAKNGKETVVKSCTTEKDALLVTISGSTTLKVVDNSMTFRDVDSRHWFKDAADFVTSRGLFQGMNAITFAPNETMSRAMLVTVLHNLEGNPYYGYYYGRLSDISNTWYETAAAWAVANGHISGFPDGTFRGEEAITREQLAMILYRYAGYPSVKEYVNSGFTGYYDYDTVSSYAYQAMYWAVSSGVLYTSGRNDLAPQRPATRAEVAQTMQNLVEFLAD